MNKISLAESMFMVAICGLADLAEVIITVVLLDLGGAGEVVKYFIDPIVWAIIGFWLKLKGVRQTWFTVGSLIELIPFADVFPTRTIAILATIKVANSEKLSAVVEKIPVPSKTGLRRTAAKNLTNKAGNRITATASPIINNLAPKIDKLEL